MPNFTIADTLCFPGCVFNASGPGSRSLKELEGIQGSSSAAVVSKSATLLPDLSEYWGNEGLDYYLDSKFAQSLSASKKPYILSLSTARTEEVLPMLDRILKWKLEQQQLQQPSKDDEKVLSPFVSAIELNLSSGESALAYDVAALDDLLARVCAHRLFNDETGEDQEAKAAMWSKTGDLFHASATLLGVKIPPFYDKHQLDQVAETIAAHPTISFVVAVNTISNALAIDTDKECEAVPPASSNSNGYCLPSACDLDYTTQANTVKHTALANVHQLYLAFQRLGRGDIALIGVGGVNTGLDVFEFMLCGATATQLGSCFFREGLGCFDRVQKELAEIMETRGYKDIETFRGGLKPYCGPLPNDSDENISAANVSKTHRPFWYDGGVGREEKSSVDLKLGDKIRSLFAKPEAGWRFKAKELWKGTTNTLINERAVLYAAVVLLGGVLTAQKVSSA